MATLLWRVLWRVLWRALCLVRRSERLRHVERLLRRCFHVGGDIVCVQLRLHAQRAKCACVEMPRVPLRRCAVSCPLSALTWSLLVIARRGPSKKLGLPHARDTQKNPQHRRSLPATLLGSDELPWGHDAAGGSSPCRGSRHPHAANASVHNTALHTSVSARLVLLANCRCSNVGSTAEKTHQGCQKGETHQTHKTRRYPRGHRIPRYSPCLFIWGISGLIGKNR